MKQFTKWILMLSILMVILTCLPTYIFAQSDPGCDPVTNTYPDGSPCPIDGGLSALLVVGVGYGIKKVRDARKNKVGEIGLL